MELECSLKGNIQIASHLRDLQFYSNYQINLDIEIIPKQAPEFQSKKWYIYTMIGAIKLPFN